MDISTTGTKITEHFKSNWYFDVDMGFEFPYYGKKMKKVYVAKRGFTTFDNTVNPLNSPRLNNIYSPKGYISPIGDFLNYAAQGDIFYRIELDRVIIQYQNVTNGTPGESITVRWCCSPMAIYDSITMLWAIQNTMQQYLNILIESPERRDGILVSHYDKPIPMYDNMAIGFDYPGPDIITSVENGSGVIMPGNSTVVKLNLATASLAEGSVKRSVNFISNDPANAQTTALVQLNITSGGISKPVVSTDTIDFGNVFQGAVRSTSFTVKNEGTANVDNFINNRFRWTVYSYRPQTRHNNAWII